MSIRSRAATPRSSTSPGAKLRAFDLGVDDTLAMPFAPQELLARSIVITRRTSGIHRPIVPTIQLGEMVIDIVSREVCEGDSIIRLSGIEQSLFLCLLASRNGRVVSRDLIFDAVWGSNFVAETNIVGRHIRGLRVKLRDDYRHPLFIATVRGGGYRFIRTFSNRGWVAEWTRTIRRLTDGGPSPLTSPDDEA